MDARAEHRIRMAHHRQQRRQEGLRETVVWLHEDVQRQIDELVEAGQFKNRSEVMSAALREFVTTT
jgi:metal-responsive CopG/Arc/MetJ family transcriptional regulator